MANSAKGSHRGASPGFIHQKQSMNVPSRGNQETFNDAPASSLDEQTQFRADRNVPGALSSDTTNEWSQSMKDPSSLMGQNANRMPQGSSINMA